MFAWVKALFGVLQPVIHAESGINYGRELTDAEWEWHDSDAHNPEFCETCSGED